MLAMNAAFQAHLNGEATTHCYCWTLRRKDAVTLGFTDHDETITFDTIQFAPQTGFSASAAEAELGLNVSTMDVEGALSSDAINADDVRRGRYDGAIVETWLVNWADVDQRLLLRKSVVGRIEMKDGAFKVELKSLAAAADRRTGRLVTRRCDAVLGDARCKVNVETSDHRVSGVVTSVVRQGTIRASGLAAKPARWAEDGRLQWTGGMNAGLTSAIVQHQINTAGVELSFDALPPAPVGVGDTFNLDAGCDHSFQTCKAKFGNALNFRGFPHLPGDEAVYAYPNGMAIHDGGALVP